MFFFLVFETTGCVYRKLDEVIPACNASHIVSFEGSVGPVIKTRCAVAGCHNGSNSNLPYLNTFAQIQGNSSDILTQLSNRAMPPANMPQLTPLQVEEIECWVNQGAKTP